MCVCVRACVRAHVCVCVCVHARPDTMMLKKHTEQTCRQIPLPPTLQVTLLQSVSTHPTGLESTSIIVAYGLGQSVHILYV